MIWKKEIKKVLEKTLLRMEGFPLSPFYSGIGHILIFHRIVPLHQRSTVGNMNIEITPEYFELVIDFFRKKNYEFISLHDLPEHLQKKGRKFVIVTFDDGFKDVFTEAYPILKKHQVPFTVYITTSFPDNKAPVWGYVLEEILKQNHRIEFMLNGNKHAFDCSTVEEKNTCWAKIRTIILHTSKSDYFSTLDQIFLPFTDGLYSKVLDMSMTWSQIRQLSQDPLVTIGSHMVNHLRPKILSDDELLQEIEESRRNIELHINKKVSHFAFPYGGREEVGERELALAESTGFDTIVTSRHANIFPGHINHLTRLPRIRVAEQDMERLRLFTLGIRPFFENGFKRIVTD